MVHGKNRIPYWIDRRLTGLADLTMLLPSRLGCPLSRKTPNMGNTGYNDAASILFPYGGAMSTRFVGTSKYDLDTPVLLVDLDRMENNIRRMTDTFEQAGVNWRPHSKGQKVPAIAHQEIAAGAIGVTCAKLEEAEVMAAAGIKDILIANQVVGPIKVARLVNLCRHADVVATVDSLQNVREIDAAAGEIGVQPRVVVEVDVGTNRCGVDPGEAAVALSEEVDRSPNLRYAGLMGWEGHTAGDAGRARQARRRGEGRGHVDHERPDVRRGGPIRRDRELRRQRHLLDQLLDSRRHRDPGGRRHLQ